MRTINWAPKGEWADEAPPVKEEDLQPEKKTKKKKQAKNKRKDRVSGRR